MIGFYDKPLIKIVPVLFILCEQKEVTVHDVKNDIVQITFRRWLTDELQICWDLIQSDVHNFELQNAEDIVFWRLEKNRKFSVKSLYNSLTIDDSGPSHNSIWKGKVPQKIKTFIWLMTNNAVLTKDNMIKRKLLGDSNCMFCSQPETVDHLFFTCPVAKVIWGVIAQLLGANNIPSSLSQCWNWCDKWLPSGRKFHL